MSNPGIERFSASKHDANTHVTHKITDGKKSTIFMCYVSLRFLAINDCYRYGFVKETGDG